MTNEVQFYDGAVLFGDSAGADTDKVAMHEDCCCGDEASSDCSDCETNCNSADPISCSVSFTKDAGGTCGDGCDSDFSVSDVSMTKQSDCYWEGTFTANGEDWVVSIYCSSGDWLLEIGVTFTVYCLGIDTVAVDCSDNRPTGTFTVDIGESSSDRCGEAVITLT